MDEGTLKEIIVDKLNNTWSNDFSSSLNHIMIFESDNISGFGTNTEFKGKISVYDGFEFRFASINFTTSSGPLVRAQQRVWRQHLFDGNGIGY